MKKGSLLTVVLLLLIPQLGISQNLYWVGFPDKKNNSFSTQKPEQFLSTKAIQRRAIQHIEITEEDLPVSRPYIDSISSTGAKILFQLKWMNGVVVKPTPAQLEAIRTLKLPLSVTSIYETNSENPSSPLSGTNAAKESAPAKFSQAFYGNGFDAISTANGSFLHQKGYLGEGMLIAIIDDGFYQANQIMPLADAFSQGRVLATKDFVNPASNIFAEDSHGTHVFSIIGANSPSIMVGTAPKANFILLRSENFNSEQLFEEYTWAAATEFADSMGADIINNSLGYTTFDIPSQNHTYSDLTGDKTPISKSCTIAAEKGIMVICSAGNEGNKTWKYISAPADAKGIITVGAITKDSVCSAFSSIGPSADGRIKPEVVALGTNVGIISNSGNPSQGNGTSYAAPIVAGMTACLWQAFPTLTPQQIRDAVIASASEQANPTEQRGYGILNAKLAYYKLLETTGKSYCIKPEVSPNPFSNDIKITIYAPAAPNATIAIYSCSGYCIYRKQWQVTPASNSITIPLPNQLPQGVYVINITCGGCLWRDKLVKQ